MKVILQCLLITFFISNNQASEVSNSSSIKTFFDNKALASWKKSNEKFKTKDYPNDLFTEQQLKRGAIILHVIGILYMFIALAVICDEYFVPSLNVITEKLEISHDVAGATFMAAGGSAPEFFASFLGIFVSRSDVGVATIVGSAVFNLMFVVGTCGILSISTLQLNWWSLLRDSIFYATSLIVLIVCFLDGKIYIIESMLLIICYISYVIFMKYNDVLEKCVKNCKLSTPRRRKETINNVSRSYATNADTCEEKCVVALQKMKPKSNRSVTGGVFRDGFVHLLINTLDPIDKAVTGLSTANEYSRNYLETITSPQFFKKVNHEVEEVNGKMEPDADNKKEKKDDNVVEDTPITLKWPSDFKKQFYYILLLPILISTYFIIPDVRKESMKKLFLVTFTFSILYIAVFSYFMVWWASVVGDICNIPDGVMGIVFLSAGTSIPDLITSVIVAKKGLGDMAISSSIGSNLFDITIGLPVPWLVYNLVYNLSPVKVESKGMFCLIILLFIMILTLVVSIMLSKWRINKLLGLFYLLLYIMFTFITILFQYNILECI